MFLAVRHCSENPVFDPRALEMTDGLPNMSVVAGENREPRAESNPACVKCGGATELVTYVRRFGDRPGYRFFECTACQAIQWKTETIDRPPKSDRGTSA